MEDKLRSTHCLLQVLGMETHPKPQKNPTASPNVPCIPPWLQVSITNRPNVSSKAVAALGINYF